MKRWHRIAIGGATFLALMLGLALAAPGFMDWNRLKPRIAGEIGRLTGRTVAIDGDIAFTLLPAPQLSARGVRIGNIKGAQAPDFLRLGSLDMRMAFWPLLKGDLSVRNIRLVQPAIALEALADGRKSWDFGDGHFFDRISFDRFEIVDGSLFYRDAASGFARAATDINAKLSIGSRDGPFSADGRLTVSGVEIAGNGHMDRAETGKPAALKAGIFVARTEGLNFAGSRVVTANGPFLTGRLGGQGGNIGKFLDSLARLSGLPNGGLAARLTGAFTLDARIADDGHVLDARDLVIKWPGSAGLLHLRQTKGARPNWDISAVFSQIDLQNLAAPDPAASALALTVPEDSDAHFDLAVDTVLHGNDGARKIALRGGIDRGVLTVEEARAQLPGNGRLALTGTARNQNGQPEFIGHAELRVGSSRALLAWAGQDAGHVAKNRLGAGTIVADVLWGPKKWAVSNLDARLDGARATGALGRDWGGARPVWTADLAADNLDWNAYAPPAGSADAGPGRWKALNDANATVKLKLDRFAVRDFRGAGLAADAALANGVLTLNGLTARDLNGGAVKAAGSATNFAAEPQLTLDGEIAAQNFAGLAALAGVNLPADGATFGGGRIAGKIMGGRDQAAFDVAVSLAGLEGRALGQVTGGFDATGGQAQLNLSGRSFADTARRLGIALPKPAEDGAIAVQGSLARAGGVVDVNLSGAIADGPVTLAGKVADPGAAPVYHLWLTMAHPDGVRMARALGWDLHPQTRDQGPLALQMSLNGPAGDLALGEISAKLGPLALTGSGHYGKAGERPRIALSLLGGDLALDGLLETPKTGLMAAQRQPALRWSHDPYDLGWLRDCDLDLDFSASRLAARGYDFGSPHLQLQSGGGQAAVKTLTARLFGGDFSLSGVIDARNTPSANLAVELKNGSADQALRALAGIRAATGGLDASMKLAARGASEAEMAASLQAVATFLAEDGELQDIDLPRLSDELPGAGSGQTALNLANAAMSSGRTPFSEIGGQVDVARGVAVLRHVTMDIPGARGSLSGRIDLPAWQIDMIAGFAPETPPMPMAELVLTGPLHAPDRQLRAQKFAARAALDRLQAVIAAIEKK